jgi:hypothetical protein
MLTKKIRQVAYMMFIATALLAFGSTTTSCKSKKKIAAEQAAADKAKRIEMAKKDLQALLDNDNLSIAEMEKKLAAIKALKIDDPAVNALIAQVEEKIKHKKELERIREEERKREEEERKRAETKTKSIHDYFNSIAAASTPDAANKEIEEALKLFTSDSAPVLIIIAEEDGEKDYDAPTTARKYLEYIKDQKKNALKVVNIGMDNNGKIKLLELRK